MKRFFLIPTLAVMAFLSGCSSNDSGGGNTDPVDDTPSGTDIQTWLTTSNSSSLLSQQTAGLTFGTTANSYGNITVDASTTYQTVDGFGYTLTGGSVQVINSLTAAKKQELLQDLFGNAGIRVSFLRLSIGASDLNANPFTYDDLPSGQTDPTLAQFNLEPDSALIAMLQEILVINPNIRIIATPWSAPVWMKTNDSFIGGSLDPDHYGTYANYFVKYVQGMAAAGITIHAVTPQNEPENPYNNPSMLMTSGQQADFIKNHLGPKFQENGLATKIVVFDHNCDHPNYPMEIYADAQANPYIDGAAFHLYAGTIGAMGTVHNAYPTKNLYFTEQYTGAGGDFNGDLRWHIKNVIIGSMRNWSKAALEWNLANDSGYGPHTDGGCSECKGAITINSSTTYTRNQAYYIVAHASKFVPAGSVRISSTESGGISTVAFKTPTNKIVLLAINDSSQSTLFNIKYNGEWAQTNLAAGSVASYVWDM